MSCGSFMAVRSPNGSSHLPRPDRRPWVEAAKSTSSPRLPRAAHADDGRARAAKTLLRDDITLSPELRYQPLEMIGAQGTRLTQITEEVRSPTASTAATCASTASVDLAGRQRRGRDDAHDAPESISLSAAGTARPRRSAIATGSSRCCQPDRQRPRTRPTAARSSSHGAGRSERAGRGRRPGHRDPAGRAGGRLREVLPSRPAAPRGAQRHRPRLYICRELVQRMGGTIGVRSAPAGLTSGAAACLTKERHAIQTDARRSPYVLSTASQATPWPESPIVGSDTVPIYEYVCMECESHFEELVRNGEEPTARIASANAQAVLVSRRTAPPSNPASVVRRAAAVAVVAAAAAATEPAPVTPRGLRAISGDDHRRRASGRGTNRPHGLPRALRAVCAAVHGFHWLAPRPAGCARPDSRDLRASMARRCRFRDEAGGSAGPWPSRSLGTFCPRRSVGAGSSSRPARGSGCSCRVRPRRPNRPRYGSTGSTRRSPA